MFTITPHLCAPTSSRFFTQPGETPAECRAPSCAAARMRQPPAPWCVFCVSGVFSGVRNECNAATAALPAPCRFHQTHCTPLQDCLIPPKIKSIQRHACLLDRRSSTFRFTLYINNLSPALPNHGPSFPALRICVLHGATPRATPNVFGQFHPTHRRFALCYWKFAFCYSKP